MKYKIFLSQEANKYIDEIFLYISNILTETETAKKMIRLLERSILSLEEMPNRFRIYEREPWRSRGVHIMPVKRYLVFYLVDESNKSINVFRIIYGSRDLDNVLE